MASFLQSPLGVTLVGIAITGAIGGLAAIVRLLLQVAAIKSTAETVSKDLAAHIASHAKEQGDLMTILKTLADKLPDAGKA